MAAKDHLSSELDVLVRPLIGALSAVKSTCIDAELISVSEGNVVMLSPEAMANAVRAEHPTIVFRSDQVFDTYEVIRSEILNAGGREGLLNRRNAVMPTIEECLSLSSDIFSARDDYVYQVSYAYASHGMIRYCVVTAGWYDDLVDILIEFIDKYEERFETEAAVHAVECEAFFRDLATVIANDERFVKARGLRKKGLLVESVWGNLIPPDPESRVVRLAQGEEPKDINFVHVVRQANDIIDKRLIIE